MVLRPSRMRYPVIHLSGGVFTYPGSGGCCPMDSSLKSYVPGVTNARNQLKLLNCLSTQLIHRLLNRYPTLLNAHLPNYVPTHLINCLPTQLPILSITIYLPNQTPHQLLTYCTRPLTSSIIYVPSHKL